MAVEKNSVIENARLCAEQGWGATYIFKSGETLERAFITQTDFEKEIVVLERVGERHLEPRLVQLVDVKSIRPDWS